MGSNRNIQADQLGTSVKGVGIFDPVDMIPLQAADFVLHAVNQRHRETPSPVFEVLKDDVD